MVRFITNEVDSKATYAGTEAVAGTAVAPDYMWPGELNISKTANLRTDNKEATGGYDRDVTPALEIPSYSGTYAEDLTFETLPMQLQYAVKTGAAGVAAGTDAYEYAKSPSFNVDDIDSATLQYGVNGLAWQSTGVRHDEFTITIDADDTDGVWKFSSNLFVLNKTALPTPFDGVATGGTATTLVMTGATWTVDEHKGKYVFLKFGSHTGQVRQIVSNTADTLTVDEAFSPVPAAGDVFRIEANLPGTIPIQSYEAIPTYGTQFFIDAYADGAPITTQILDRIISFNMTVQSTRTTKRFLENARDEFSARSGRGAREVTGQIRVELDRRDEYVAWETLKEFGLRVHQVGSEISTGVTHEAEIIIPRAAFSTPNEDARENNMTATFPFRAYLPDTDPIFTISAINSLATLP